jgi:oligopeptide transport system permease protein
MLRFVGRRLLIMFITLYVIISLTWVMSKALPGTPFADEKLTPSSRAILFEKYGLDDPLPVQYVRYMLNVAQGDLGNSFYFESRPVTQIILELAPVSAFIGAQAIIFGLIPGLVLGVLAALRHNGVLDYLGTTVAVGGIAVPSFVLGPIMQYWIGYKWGMLPIAWDPFNPQWAQSVLPSVSLSVFVIAIVARYVRSEMLEVLGQDYVTLAKAKGLSWLAVVWKHVLRNSLIPLVTVLFPLMVGLITRSGHRGPVRAFHLRQRLRDDTRHDDLLLCDLHTGLPGPGCVVRDNRPPDTCRRGRGVEHGDARPRDHTGAIPAAG